MHAGFDHELRLPGPHDCVPTEATAVGHRPVATAASLELYFDRALEIRVALKLRDVPGGIVGGDPDTFVEEARQLAFVGNLVREVVKLAAQDHEADRLARCALKQPVVADDIHPVGHAAKPPTGGRRNHRLRQSACDAPGGGLRMLAHPQPAKSLVFMAPS